jgi:hypothetical protein
MQNAQDCEIKEAVCSTNKFNNAEYKRWSDGITRGQSSKTQWGVESFLGTSEYAPAVREDISLSLIETGEK